MHKLLARFKPPVQHLTSCTRFLGPPAPTRLIEGSCAQTGTSATATAAWRTTCQHSMTQQKQEYDKQWHDTWQGGLQPGQAFDAGCPSPLLTHLLSSGKLVAQGKKTFVPGCGRGYDVFAFAEAGASVSAGLDLSPEAVAAAQAEANTRLASNSAALSRVHLDAGDFFSHADSAGFQGPFHVGYDYTFLCALHPDMRQDWARAWSQLLAPGGELVTLIFPVGGVPDHAPARNPPWAVTPELYQELLLPAGFEQVVLEPVNEELSHKPRAGREWLGRWRRTGSSNQQQPVPSL